MRVFLGLGNVALFEVFLAHPLGHDVTHVLRWESDRERIIRLVLGHRGNTDVLGVREIRFRGSIDISQELGHLAHPI